MKLLEIFSENIKNLEEASVAQVNKFVQDSVQLIEDGILDGHEVMVLAKFFEEVGKKLRANKIIAGSTGQQVDKYGKGEDCKFLNATISASSKASYSYNLGEFDQSFEEWKAEKKRLEGLAKNAKLVIEDVNSMTGEPIEVSPAIVKYSNSYSVSLKK